MLYLLMTIKSFLVGNIYMTDHNAVIEIGNFIVNILVAIGTIGAVVVSLYLALSTRKIRAKASISFNTLYLPSPTEDGYVPSDKLVVISVTNIGEKPFKIDSIAAGDNKTKNYLVMTPDYRNPHTTEAGHFYLESQTGQYVFQQMDFVRNLNKALEVSMVKDVEKRIKNLNFVFATNIGQLVKIKADKNFIDMYVKVSKNLIEYKSSPQINENK